MAFEFYISFVGILMQFFPFFYYLAILLFSEIALTLCHPIRSVIILVINKSEPYCFSSDFVITRMITDRIGLHSLLLPLRIVSI